MRVLLINGSPRREGNTFIALSEIAKVLEQEGIEREIVGIPQPNDVQPPDDTINGHRADLPRNDHSSQ